MDRAADILRQARRLGGVSQVELSRRTGIAQPTISAYEREVHEPSLKSLRTLVAGTGMRLNLTLLPSGQARELPTTVLGTLLRDKRDELVAVAKRHGASNLRVFGSVARGEDGPDSDIDMLVDLAPGTSLTGLGRIQEALETVLGRKVDVTPASALKAGLKDSVLAEAIALEAP